MRLDAAMMAVYYFGMPANNLDFMDTLEDSMGNRKAKNIVGHRE
jgi:hypothetical protein